MVIFKSAWEVKGMEYKCWWGCRKPITEADLKPNGELKARIQAWRAGHAANKGGDAMEE